MQREFYYSKSSLVLYALVCSFLALILISFFVAVASSLTTWYILGFCFLITCIVFLLFSKFFKLLFGKTPAISILDDRIIFEGIKSKKILFSSIKSAKLTRLGGPDGTTPFKALHLNVTDGGDTIFFIPTQKFTMPLTLVNVDPLLILNVIQEKLISHN